MGQPINWSGDYVKDTKDMLSALGTFERMGIIHEDWVNEFYYGSILSEFKDYDYYDKDVSVEGFFDTICDDYVDDEIDPKILKDKFMAFDFEGISEKQKKTVVKLMDKMDKEESGNIHLDEINDFFYDIDSKYKAGFTLPTFMEPDDREEFEGSLWDLVEQVDNETAKKIAEALREQISNSNFIWNR